MSVEAGHRYKEGRRRGVAAVEAALTLPLILTTMIGVWEMGRVIEVEQILVNAAREGARQAGTGQLTNSQVQQVVLQVLKIGLNDTTGTMTQNAAVTVQDLTQAGVDVSNATTLDTLQVSVSVPYNDVRWTALVLVTNATTTLKGTVTWTSLVDVAYPNTTPQPPQG
jgi:Flp pilus assembly protein TadG